jgi:LmbE family N-acetylglucosaminyl deacetylase
VTGTRFDHRASATDAAAWDRVVRDAPRLTGPVRTDRVVVLAAHPDDETLGAGGLVAAAAAAGAEIVVLVATDGEASHPDSPTHTPARLRGLRRAEVRAAVAALAPTATLHRLGLPDGALADHADALSVELARHLPGATHLVTPWSADGHPDHDICGLVGAALVEGTATRHWQYPIWAWHWADPDGAAIPAHSVRALDIDAAALAAKRRALECYPSQHRPLSDQPGDEPILGPRQLEHFARPAEVFLVGPAGDTPAAFFEDLYAAADDPWGLAERWYERRKRAVLLAGLPRPRFGRAFEPGCATGLITAELAARCDHVLAWDVTASAVTQTSLRLAGVGNVDVEQGQIPGEWPDGRFDLVVLSEVGYYCADLDRLARRVDSSLTPDGVLVGCHWRHPAATHPRTADAVHKALGAGLHAIAEHAEEDFLLHVWTRTGRSVAHEDGLL